MITRSLATHCLVLAVALGPAALAQSVQDDYRAEIEAWRQNREERLEAEGGWLTVVGLFWLKEGRNRVGSARGSEVLLPDPAPSSVGEIMLSEGRVLFQAAPHTDVQVDGRPVTELTLIPDTQPGHQVVKLGQFWLHLIDRQGKLGIRLKDMNSERLRGFTGLEWYPVEESYRVEARFVTHPTPRSMPIANVLGQVEDLMSPGYAAFTLNGQAVELHPVLDSPDSQALFFIFRDATSAKTTYGAGRFLYSPLPKDGKVILDFNKAYSPPCAFTDFATCPLPPPQNRLSVAIEAGEKTPPTAH